MPNYEVREFRKYHGPELPDGHEIVDTYQGSRPSLRAALVRLPDPPSERVATYEVGNDEPVTPTCSFPTENGSCSRTVEEEGDRCWQHSEEDDE